jgi:hypothetical protein
MVTMRSTVFLVSPQKPTSVNYKSIDKAIFDEKSWNMGLVIMKEGRTKKRKEILNI